MKNITFIITILTILGNIVLNSSCNSTGKTKEEPINDKIIPKAIDNKPIKKISIVSVNEDSMVYVFDNDSLLSTIEYYKVMWPLNSKKTEYGALSVKSKSVIASYNTDLQDTSLMKFNLNGESIIEYLTGVHLLLGQNSSIEFINRFYENNKYYHYFCNNDTCELTLLFEQNNDDKIMPLASLNSPLFIPLNDALFIVTHLTYTIVNQQPIQFKAYISTQDPEYRISGSTIKPTIVEVYDYKYKDDKLSDVIVNRYKADNELLGTGEYKIYYYSD